MRGTGRVAVKPDTAVVLMGAEMRAPTVAEATADVARRSSAVIDRVKSLGVAERDIGTVAYSIDPVTAPRRTEEDPTRIVAYRVVNVVRVKIRDLGAVGRILDGALTAGANTISGLQFTVDDPSRPEAEARALAVKAAASTAQQLATAAGVGLGELMSLTEEAAAAPGDGAEDGAGYGRRAHVDGARRVRPGRGRRQRRGPVPHRESVTSNGQRSSPGNPGAPRAVRPARSCR